MGGHMKDMKMPADYDGGMKERIRQTIGTEGLSLLEQRQLLAENHMLRSYREQAKRSNQGADFLCKTIAWLLILFVGLPLAVGFWLGLFNLFAGHG